VVEALEEAAAGWSAALAALMQAEGDKRPGGKGPMAEVEFWRARSAVLSGVSEQLALPRAQEMLAVLEAGSEDRQLLAALKGQMAELEKLATEVGDGRGAVGSGARCLALNACSHVWAPMCGRARVRACKGASVLACA
jgi:hypothetical protein